MSIPIRFDWRCTFYVPFESLKRVENQVKAAAQKSNSDSHRMPPEWEVELLPPSRRANVERGPETKDMAIVAHTLRFSNRVDTHGTLLKVRSEQDRLLNDLRRTTLNATIEAIHGFVIHDVLVTDWANIGKGQTITRGECKLKASDSCELIALAKYFYDNQKLWKTSLVHRPFFVWSLQFFGLHKRAGARERARCLAAQEKASAAVTAVILCPNKGHNAAKKSLHELSTQNREMMNFLMKTFSDKMYDAEQDAEKMNEKMTIENELKEFVSTHKEKVLEFHRDYRTLQHDVSGMNGYLAVMWNNVHRLSRQEDVEDKLRRVEARCDGSDLQLFLTRDSPQLGCLAKYTMKGHKRLQSGFDNIFSRGLELGAESWELAERLRAL
ncbi:hypothetical protein ACHAQA_003017 [Verticillium albo-atrum]